MSCVYLNKQIILVVLCLNLTSWLTFPDQFSSLENVQVIPISTLALLDKLVIYQMLISINIQLISTVSIIIKCNSTEMCIL